MSEGTRQIEAVDASDRPTSILRVTTAARISSCC